MHSDEGLGALDPAVEINGSKHRLGYIAHDIVAEVGMVFARLLAEPDESRNVESPSDVGAGFPRDQRIVAAAHLALGLVGEALIEPVRDHQPQDPVAEEFQSFIGFPAMATVGHRPFEQFRILGLAAQCFADEGRKFDHG